MDNGREKYLLRQRYQYDAFKLKWAKLIELKADEYVKWIDSLPFMEWIPLLMKPQEEEPVIGLICMLYWDKRINITFQRGCTHIQHVPKNDEEELAWMKAAGWHGKGIDRE